MQPVHYLYLFLILFTIYGIAVGSYPKFKMNRASIALVGAAVLILSGAISLEDAFTAVDLNTILLLFSMMIINANLKICGFFNLVAVRIIKYAHTPKQLLLIVIFMSGFLSALFLNDTIVLVLTPLLITILLQLKRNPIPYLIALVTAANIGSSATLIGNPQNMIIGVASGISFTKYFLYQSLPSVAGMIIIYLVIYILYRREFSNNKFELIQVEEARTYKPLLLKSIISLAVMLTLMIAGVQIALAAFVSASILLITRRLKPERVFFEIDWTLLVFFSALFIVTKSIETAGFDRYLFYTVKPFLSNGIINFSVSAAVLSNLISNVPAVVLLKPIIPQLPDPQRLWLILGMASTFAGNLTLIGSVANLIVAESAQKNNIKLGFWEYFKSGSIITILSMIIGLLWFTIIN